MTDGTANGERSNPTVMARIRAAMAQVHQVSGPTMRSQHPKTHGVVQATFQVHDLPDACRVGIFAVPGPIAAWVRFSNGREVDDRRPDVHGMAIKLVNVPGDNGRPDAGRAAVQDFVLADHPVFFARDAAHFLQFLSVKGEHAASLAAARAAGATDADVAALTAHQARELVSAFPVLREFFKTASSVLALSYFSQTPYRFGDRVVKYFARPVAPPAPAAPADAPDTLRDRMRQVLTAERTPVSFAFGIEVLVDAAAMPVEDATVAWASPEQVVLATITIPPQEFLSADRQAFGEALSFSPWHARPEHEPLGSLNRARFEAYMDSSATRHAATGAGAQVPTESACNAATLARFFEALGAGDVRALQLCLHPDVHFQDIGFDLQRREVGAMWHMILAKKPGVTYRDIEVHDDVGTAHWECDYEFSRDPESSPRPVHNVIDSRFRFEGGLIREHEDTCDFWAWFAQAMGGPAATGARVADALEGALERVVGRDVPLDVEDRVRAKVKKAARDKIDRFIAQHPEYAS
jgi:hypothetical protein